MIGPESNGAIRLHIVKIPIGCVLEGRWGGGGKILLTAGFVSSVTRGDDCSHRRV